MSSLDPAILNEVMRTQQRLARGQVAFVLPFFVSASWVAPHDGTLHFRAIGAGGSGAASNAQYRVTGGYSAGWGGKTVRVKKGATVVVTIGAGGLARVSSSANPVLAGQAGGDTTVTVGGITYIAPGGPGGIAQSGVAPPAGPLPSGNWDFGAASVAPGFVGATGQWATGGAGVDILARGNNATASDSTNYSGGGGTGGPSVAGIGGGAIGTSAATGQPAGNPGVYFDAASAAEWGISFFGGSGSTGPSPAGNGGGGFGVGSGSSSAGGFGGGGGAGGTSGGSGGLGGGGGAGRGTLSSNYASSGPGGDGYAVLRFYPNPEI